MQILHGDGASYSSKAERFDGKVTVTITRVMALPMRAAGMLRLGRKIHREVLATGCRLDVQPAGTSSFADP
ncbi:hypothetical protein AOA59_18200 [Pseudomonas sp. 2822-15]|nr:hypothetical protein AOA59_18200 [Pseudomonas sp. 2822-15]